MYPLQESGVPPIQTTDQEEPDSMGHTLLFFMRLDSLIVGLGIGGVLLRTATCEIITEKITRYVYTQDRKHVFTIANIGP